MVPPRTDEWRTRISPVSSPFWLETSRMRMAAPMPVRKSSRAARVGFSPTPRSTSSEPGTSKAATRKNAAEERSHGTASSRAVSLGRLSIAIACRPTRTSAPNSRSAISV